MKEDFSQNPRQSPLVITETAELSREEWLSFRRRGIGGSDVAAILGISPFRTARDIYYDKLQIADVEEEEGNCEAMEIGHLLEDLVAEIFHRKTGYEIYQIKKMFAHPQYPFMLADVDYFITLPDRKTAILEIKTTNYNARDNWWLGGKETVPVYYETQGRHYMAVMDIDQVFFCCLYGNTEDEIIIREIKRETVYEEEMIYLEREFWEGYVQKKLPPPYTENGDLIVASSRRHSGAANMDAPVLPMGTGMTATLMRYLELQEEKKNSEKHSKKLESEMQRLKGILIAEMGSSCTALCEKEGVNYTITYNPIQKAVIDKDNLLRLKLQYPDIYEKFVTVSESRRFQVKIREAKAV